MMPELTRLRAREERSLADSGLAVITGRFNI
jgi:hypothetical protein